MQKIANDKVKFDKKFKEGELVAYKKEKKNEKGKFCAQYVGPYKIIAFGKGCHMLFLMPTLEEVKVIIFMVLGFDIMHCVLDLDLT